MLFIPVLVPGSLLQFFVGGGMSMIDGLSPDWRTDLALVPRVCSMAQPSCMGSVFLQAEFINSSVRYFTLGIICNAEDTVFSVRKYCPRELNQ